MLNYFENEHYENLKKTDEAAAVGFSVFIIGKFIHECVKERKEKSLQNKSVEEITSHDNQE